MKKRKIYTNFSIILLVFGLIIFFFQVDFSENLNKEEIFKKKGNKIKIVGYNTIITDWVENVVGNLGEVDAIVKGATDIHTYTYTSADVQKVAMADVFIKMGINGLEPNVDNLIAAAQQSNPTLKVFTLKNSTRDDRFGIKIKIDPLLGSSGGPNDHFWMSPLNAMILVKKICHNMTLLYPTNETYFNSSRDIYINKLNALMERINTTFKYYYNGLKLVINHPAFIYLFELLGINRTRAIENVLGAEPTALHLAEIIDFMTNNNDVNIIIVNPQHSDEHAIQLARDTGSKLVYLTPLLGVYNIYTYIEMIDYDIISLYNPVDPPTDPLNNIWIQWLIYIFIIGAIASVVLLLYWRYKPSN